MSSSQNIADDLLAMLRNENEGARGSQIEFTSKNNLTSNQTNKLPLLQTSALSK